MVFPWLIWVIFYIYRHRHRFFRNWRKLLQALLVVFLTLSFIYARFVEPRLITIRQQTVSVGFNAKIAVISDVHLGIYKDNVFLSQVVTKINSFPNIDAVLIPGDLTYEPSGDLTTLFAPLKQIKFPVYAVLGNHDTGHPGPAITNDLIRALQENNVTVLDNSSARLPTKDITILGLGELWSGDTDLSTINQFTTQDNLIVLAHNPDVTLSYQNFIPDITITGHTHGGQIRIPFLYKYIIPCVGDFDQGIYYQPHGPVYVSAGLGETAIPVRLFDPPGIDIIALE